MSKKTKKNVNNKGLRIQLKQRQIKIENELFNTIVRFTKACNAYDLFNQLSPEEHWFLKKIQYRTVLIKAEKNSGISDSIIRAVKKDLMNYLQSEKIVIEGSNEIFTLLDLCTAGVSLWQWAWYNSKDNALWMAVYEKITSLSYYFENDENAHYINKIFYFLQRLADRYTSVTRYFLWFTSKLDYVDHRCTLVYTMHREPSVRKHVTIDNILRPVYRVGYAVQIDGLRWAKVKGEQLFPFRNEADVAVDYPVFVQSHALERIKERLFPIPFYEDLLAFAFEKGEISLGPGGKLFFSVMHADCKLGYLVTSFTGREIIVQSFLFITHTGTSEGDSLNERLRVKTYSKKYFGLDSLCNYITTDICVDPFFRSVLIECGCSDLIKYKGNFSEKCMDDRNFSENLRRELALEDEIYEQAEMV